MNETTTNYYEILQVSPQASPEVISAAYRMLSKKAHPDAGGTHELGVALNEAKDVLLDPAKRADYDKMLESRKAKTYSPGGASNSKRYNERSGEQVVEVTIAVCARCGSKNRLRNGDSLAGARCSRCGSGFGTAREPANDRVADAHQKLTCERCGAESIVATHQLALGNAWCRTCHAALHREQPMHARGAGDKYAVLVAASLLAVACIAKATGFLP